MLKQFLVLTSVVTCLIPTADDATQISSLAHFRFFITLYQIWLIRYDLIILIFAHIVFGFWTLLVNNKNHKFSELRILFNEKIIPLQNH